MSRIVTLQYVQSELRQLWTSRIARLGIVAVIMIPLLYAGTYLWAFWDPAGHLERVPAAIVNEDLAADIEGARVSVGQTLTTKLIDAKAFDWTVTSRSAATAGVADGTYYFAIIVPSGFSSSIASAADPAGAKQATFSLLLNDANSYIATTIASRAVAEIRSQLASDVGKGEVAALLTGLGDVRTGLSSAGTAATTLSDGLSKLDDGSAQLAGGTRALADGSAAVRDGATSAAAGATRLANGLATLRTGTGTLADGTARLARGAKSVAAGAAQLSAASSDLADGTASVAAGAAGVSSGAGRLASTIAALAASPSLDQTTASNLQALAQQASALAAGAAQLADGGARAAAGATRLSAGAASLSSGADRAADAAGAVNTGASRIATAVADASTGATALATGSRDLPKGAAALAVGAKRAETGADTLATGLAQAADGASRLADGLEGGAARVPSVTGTQIYTAAQSIASPVAVETVHATPSATYGVGLAPYFIGLALWVGAVFAFGLVRPVARRRAGEQLHALRRVVAGFVQASALSAAQALVLLVILAVALGLSPAYPLQLTAFLILTTIAFAAVVQALIASMGGVGRVVAIAFLIVQLAASGGTYPIQTAPEFFRTISPFVPMTYFVTAARRLISGGSLEPVGTAAIVLLGATAGALLVTWLVARAGREKEGMIDFGPSGHASRTEGASAVASLPAGA